MTRQVLVSDTSARESGQTAPPWGRWIALVVFLVALTTRLLWITVPINTDETLWVRRAPAFYRAVLDGRPADTFQKHHPGVPGMWVTGAGIIARYQLRSLLPGDRLTAQHDDLRAYLRAVELDRALPLGTYAAARAAAALVTSASVLGIFLLSRRLFGAQIAILAAIFLLFEPFFVAYQRFITTDAFQINFTWLSFLTFLLCYDGVSEPQRRRTWLLFSGVLFGLAVMSKVSAVISAPAFLLVAGIGTLRSNRKPPVLIADLALWGLAAVVTAFLVWPALRADPLGTIAAWRSGLEDEVDGHLQFFLGDVTYDPGPAYYPVVLLLRLSPLLLAGSVLGVIALVNPAWRKHTPNPQALWANTLLIAVVIAGITLVPSKIDRYILPLLPGLALLAGAGILAAVCRWYERRPGRAAPRFAPVALAALVCQLTIMLPSFPYYVTYFNPFLGGAHTAQKAVMIGNGELMDRAGAWAQANLPQTRIVSWLPDILSSYYGETTLGVLDGTDREYGSLVEANYVMLYINQMQRNVPAAVTQYFGPQQPVHTSARNGVNYVTVYPGPSVLPDDAALLPKAERFDFGGSVQLVGRQLDTPRVAVGENAGITLYWQPIGPFEEPDTRVLTRVVDAKGRVWGQTYREPVGGMLKVEDWPAGQMIRDYQTVRVFPGTPPGEYSLEIGMYSQYADRSLPITGPEGPRGNQVILERIIVERPVGQPDLSRDLGVNTVPSQDVRLSGDGPRFLGVDWPSPTIARAGDGIPMASLWQAGRSAPRDTVLYLQLSDGARTWRRKLGQALGEDYPPAGWTPGELVRDAWTAYLPADAPAGHYDIGLIAADTAGERTLTDLGELDLITREHDLTPPRPATMQAVSLGASISLAGYDLPEGAAAGAPLSLTLYWRALDELPTDYTRFVHLLDSAGRIVAQNDATPGDGAYPTASWVAGEAITDEVQLQLPSDLPAGTYQPIVGLYNPVTGLRLTTGDGQEQITLSRPVDVR